MSPTSVALSLQKKGVQQDFTENICILIYWPKPYKLSFPWIVMEGILQLTRSIIIGHFHQRLLKFGLYKLNGTKHVDDLFLFWNMQCRQQGGICMYEFHESLAHLLREWHFSPHTFQLYLSCKILKDAKSGSLTLNVFSMRTFLFEFSKIFCVMFSTDTPCLCYCIFSIFFYIMDLTSSIQIKDYLQMRLVQAKNTYQLHL